MKNLDWNLESYRDLFRDKQVLDLACHGGNSSFRIKKCGANSVLGVDIRSDLISHAISVNQDQNIQFVCNDITDYIFLTPVVDQANVVTCFGALYHLFDHFRFFSHILKSNIDYCVLETLYGPETPNPEMFWGYEPTNVNLNGWMSDVEIIPHGTPNLSWIKQSANIFGFDIDFIARRYVQSDFSKVTDENRNKRMVVRLYNTKKFSHTAQLDISEIWEWNNDNLVQGKI
jgi:SAM-dependent methyltransferase